MNSTGGTSSTRMSPSGTYKYHWGSSWFQSSGAVWKSRWPSWAPRPNEPYSFCGRKATLNPMHKHWSQFFPNMSTRHHQQQVVQSRGSSGAASFFFFTELGICEKVEVAVLCSPFLTVLAVSVDVQQHWRTELGSCVKVPNSPYVLCSINLCAD